MSGANSKPGTDSDGQPDPLSATAMFLKAYPPQSDPAEADLAESLIKPATVAPARAEVARAEVEEIIVHPLVPSEQPPALGSVAGGSAAGGSVPERRSEHASVAERGEMPARPFSFEPVASQQKPAAPGEFTQLFKSVKPTADPLPPTSREIPPVAKAAADPSPGSGLGLGSGSGPGEFTRIFVQPSKLPDARRTRIIPSAAPPAPSSEATGLKGFSSPGASDSASAPGSFTKYFQSAPMPPVQPPDQRYAEQAASAPPSSGETVWPPAFDSGSGPLPVNPPPASGGLTEIFRSLSSAETRQGEGIPITADPAPFAMPAAPQAAPPAPGSLTSLIQKLGEDFPASTTPVLATPVSTSPAGTPMPFADLPGSAPMPAGNAGPGEFTRIISGAAIQGAVIQGVAVQGGGVAAGAPAAMPKAAVPLPAVPAIAPPHVQAPKVELPKMPAPQAVPPAVPAPKSKLQEMLPILLVLNAFLLVVLIVVVLFFVLRAK